MGDIYDALQRAQAPGDGSPAFERHESPSPDGPVDPSPVEDAVLDDAAFDGAVLLEDQESGASPALTARDESEGDRAPAPPHRSPTPPGESEQAWESDSGPAGLIRIDPDRFDDRLVVSREPSKAVAEQYRSIRTGMLARWRHQRHLIHTITSATPQEGKTITSLNLGLSFSELRNRRTIVIEADLRIPQFANLMRLDENPGLVDVLEGGANYRQAVQSMAGGNLHVIAAGRRAHDQAIQLLSSSAMADLFKDLRREYDHVIIDTPPVVELADAGILGALSDDVLLIVRMNRTPRTLIDQAISTLNSYNAPVEGLIATDHPRHRERYYNYRYGYRYHYGYYGKAA